MSGKVPLYLYIATMLYTMISFAMKHPSILRSDADGAGGGFAVLTTFPQIDKSAAEDSNFLGWSSSGWILISTVAGVGGLILYRVNSRRLTAHLATSLLLSYTSSFTYVIPVRCCTPAEPAPTTSDAPVNPAASSYIGHRPKFSFSKKFSFFGA